MKTRLVAWNPLSTPFVPMRVWSPKNSVGLPSKTTADVVAEGHQVAVEHPEDADQRQGAEALIIIMLRTLFARTMPP